jgi:hypothetical protein
MLTARSTELHLLSYAYQVWPVILKFD